MNIAGKYSTGTDMLGKMKPNKCFVKKAKVGLTAEFNRASRIVRRTSHCMALLTPENMRSTTKWVSWAISSKYFAQSLDVCNILLKRFLVKTFILVYIRRELHIS